MDAQGLVRAGAARGRALGRAVRGGEAGGAQDGVPHVPAGVHRDAVPDHPSRTTDRLSAAGVESVAADLAPRGRRSATAAALLTETNPGGVGRKPTATTQLTNEGAIQHGSLNQNTNQ